jgi:hypothetical protein
VGVIGLAPSQPLPRGGGYSDTRKKWHDAIFHHREWSSGRESGGQDQEADPKGEIHIFTEEAYPFYYRVRFPEFVAEELTIQNLTIHTKEWYQSKDIDPFEEPITEVMPKKRGHSVRKEDLWL